MAIITNKDIKIMVDVEELLHKKIETEEEGELWTQYWNVVERMIAKKKEIANKQNNWNKNNRAYHNITNKISYYKSKNNGAKVEELRKELEALKGGKA